jgi:hypothetical protein
MRGSALDRTLPLLLRPLLGSAAREVLAGELDRRSIRAFVRESQERFRELTATIPAEPTLGARLMVRLAAVTVASYEALRERGFDEASARSRVAAINWRIYERFTRLPWGLTRLFSRDRVRRVKRAMDWFMRFPYASPGYEMVWVRNETDLVGFDVHRCPAAAYFGARGLSSLCTDAFCDLDHPLAEIWGVDLERPLTIAKGCDHCDFRFSRMGSRGWPRTVPSQARGFRSS